MPGGSLGLGRGNRGWVPSLKLISFKINWILIGTKINYLEIGTDPSEDRMTCGTMRDTHLTLVKLKRKQKEKKGKKERKTERKRGEEREREKGLYLPSMIYGDRVVVFRWAKV